MPVLTLETMIRGMAVSELKEVVKNIEEQDFRKRARHIQKCKNVAWQRWTTEYLRALCEHHNLRSWIKKNHLSKGDTVLIHGDQKSRGRWNIEIVMKLKRGREGVVWSARIKCGKSMHLYPIELSCYLITSTKKDPATLYVNVQEYIPEQTAPN